MLRRITGFRQDDAHLWIAELECGHGQHVRHNPPWEIRPWVVAEGTRTAMIGTTLSCPICRAPFASRPPR
jgi:Protein of unknown function (DUF3565)